MIEVTEKPKVTLMGYSQGGAQMFYALAKNQDFYADKVHRFVSLSGCPVPAVEEDYDDSVDMFWDLYEDGIYNYGGNDESSYDEDDEEGKGWSVKTHMYDAQIHFAGRLQEPIELEPWGDDQIYSTEILMSAIDRTPVSILHTSRDELCPVEFLKDAYEEMTVEEKYIVVERGDHGYFASETPTRLVNFVAETIENG